MTDIIQFKFDGKIADDHRMDFYESARFQYAASRLCIKLDKFRRTGDFPKKVTNASNTGFQLTPFKAGSFDVNVIAPVIAAAAPLVIEASLSAMWTYVIERVFRPADDDNIRHALETQRHLADSYDRTIAGQQEIERRTLDLLQSEQAKNGDLTDAINQLMERLLAEAQRRAYLEGQQDALAKITPEQDANLVTMAAPLLKELSVPLRRSADRATISIGDENNLQSILSASKAMTDEVELTVVDPEITTILIDVVQYNKENGWGKFRNAQFDGLASFSVPADRKSKLKGDLTRAMNQDEVYVQAYYVRSKSGQRLRIIVVAIVDIEALEQGRL